MLPQRDQYFAANQQGLAICGEYFPPDCIHVGITWDWDGERKIVHYIGTNIIKVEDINQGKFLNYYFQRVTQFNIKYLDSFIALAELIAENKVNNLSFNRNSIVYNGGVFKISNGNYLDNGAGVNIINCGIFVIALFETYDVSLIDWQNWPPVSLERRNNYLASWLDNQGIEANERDAYYNFNKEIRGKHVLVSPRANYLPCEFQEAEQLAKEFLIAFQ